MAGIAYAIMDQENLPLPSKGQTKKGGKGKDNASKPAVKPLQSSSGHNIEAGKKGKTIEETYQKKTQLEHILLRPDTYVGSVEKHTQTLWVYEGGKMVNRAITYVPGLYKIFDEILVNAADNKQRDPSMDSVKVVIDVEQNSISVYNSGQSVPVEIHSEEGVYVPEMIFGHLLTSSNYDDSIKKTTGGRNGYGAKLANIFSNEFVIETADGKRLKLYKQVFKNNMTWKSEASITKCKESENWTKVTFKPDLAKFNMERLEDDVVALMSKRVVDIAGCLGKTVKVDLNGQRVPVKTFQDYVGLYLSAASENRPEPLPRIYERVNDRWEIFVSLSEGQFQQVSFANAISTIKGGTHVQYVTDQIVNHVMGVVNKKNKNAGLKSFQIRNHMWVFVNALIDNPAFDSQTKETLTLRQSSFGSKCDLSPEFMKKVAKCGVVENVLSWADFKQSKELKKNDGAKRQRLTGITKLDDANDAGGKYSEHCTLILTEGDSAKALAMSGISVVGRNRYGVFPLRGKLLNVREASHKQIMENQEINHIKQILGLQHGKSYDSVKLLRYGHLMIMTDQDHDGSHIKGLLINFVHSFWPSLLKLPEFLVEFVTPIVKATHKNGKVISFYTMPEYENWKESLGGRTSGWTIKYYKGLGTSSAKEGKEYFRALDKHKKDFVWKDEEDGNAIEMAFSKKKIEARKQWLRQFEPGTYLDQSVKLIRYTDFVNKELRLFSMADLSRSIPSMVDGLKPGQRKILFCSFKRNFVSQAKVAQFSGYVSEHSAYHHGEQSLVSTIIGMAQNFVGSNNINLMAPLGQFGTRNQGGKDHASGRYVYTCLSPITRFLFSKDDDVLLDYLVEDGQSIEPVWYCPILPMVLVNGAEGIGTGWSTMVPNYNPRDIVENLRRLLDGQAMKPMDPWYKGFKGTIERSCTKEAGVSYTVTGVIEQNDETTVTITELPIRKWTQDYKEFLESLMSPTDKLREPFIKDYREHNTDTRVNFEVHLSEENMALALAEGLAKKFKVTTTISTTNMHLFDPDGHIKKYETPEEILESFYHIRLALYQKRKEVQLANMQHELLKLDNKVRFILGVVGGEIVVSNRKRADLLLELKVKGFTPFPKKSKSSEPPVAGAVGAEEQEEEEGGNGIVRAGDYEYLLSLAIGTLTLEKVQQLCGERDKVNSDVEELRRATPHSLWNRDLNAFIQHLEAQEVEEAKEEEFELKHMAKEGRQGAKSGASKAPPVKRAPKKKAETAKPPVAVVQKEAAEKIVYPPAIPKPAEAVYIDDSSDEEKEESTEAIVPKHIIEAEKAKKVTVSWRGRGVVSDSEEEEGKEEGKEGEKKDRESKSDSNRVVGGGQMRIDGMLVGQSSSSPPAVVLKHIIEGEDDIKKKTKKQTLSQRGRRVVSDSEEEEEEDKEGEKKDRESKSNSNRVVGGGQMRINGMLVGQSSSSPPAVVPKHIIEGEDDIKKKTKKQTLSRRGRRVVSDSEEEEEEDKEGEKKDRESKSNSNRGVGGGQMKIDGMLVGQSSSPPTVVPKNIIEAEDGMKKEVRKLTVSWRGRRVVSDSEEEEEEEGEKKDINSNRNKGGGQMRIGGMSVGQSSSSPPALAGQKVGEMRPPSPILMKSSSLSVQAEVKEVTAVAMTERPKRANQPQITYIDIGSDDSEPESQVSDFEEDSDSE